MPSFMRKINIIGRCAIIYRSVNLKDIELSGVHHSYILTLCRRPGMSQEQIARHIYINKSNVTRHLTQLEKSGFIERRQSERDKRMLLVYPTEKAFGVLPRVLEVIRGWNSYLTADFSEEEIEQFNSMLARIAERATTAVNKEFEDKQELP